MLRGKCGDALAAAPDTPVQRLFGTRGEASEGAREHPAGISYRWSVVYVWMQYVQWYKVLFWLLVMMLGGSDVLIPRAMRQLFRVEELILQSEHRVRPFSFGQRACL